MASTVKTWINNNDTIECEAEDLNGFKNENNNLIQSTNQILNTSNNNQTSLAVAIYSARGDYYTDTGLADNYILSVIPNQTPLNTYYEGMRVSFIPANTNTGPSTVNINGIGSADIVTETQDPLPASALVAGIYTSMFYDGTQFRIIKL